MIVLLTGVSCVGKTTVGGRLAEDVGIRFFDLDGEIEQLYGETVTPHAWKKKGAQLLKKILDENLSDDIVVAMPPNGLMHPYLGLIKKSRSLVVVLTDRAENILERATFYDDNSEPIDKKKWNAREKRSYLREITKDINYYKLSYSRAHFALDIAGLSVEQAATALKDLLGFERPAKKTNRPQLTIVARRTTQSCVTHTNRKGHVYYLHVGKTKKGNPRYHFSTKDNADLATAIPEGYEIYENPNSQVFLRKIVPKLTSDEELEILDRALKKHARPGAYRVDVRGETITVFESSQRGQSFEGLAPFLSVSRMQEWIDQNAYFTAVLRFVLMDEKKRLFEAERYCFRGSREDWMPLSGGGPAPLKDLVDQYVPHLGEDSFFELM